MLAAYIRRRFFFVISTTGSTHRLFENFHLICHLQRVNATWKYIDRGSSSFSKWQNGRMVVVVNIAGSLCKAEDVVEKDDFKADFLS